MNRNGRYNHYSVYVNDDTDKWIKEMMKKYEITEKSKMILLFIETVRTQFESGK